MELIRKSPDERYDVVIVGGGHNGVTLAAYLSKCGLRVCVLEEKPEAGGACENVEPRAGVRINPHAILNYAMPAPGWEQLQLWKYGFRMSWNPRVKTLEDYMASTGRSILTTEGVAPLTEKDMTGFAKISGLLGSPPFTTELLRATFWCPPHPPEVEINENTVPYMQVYKQRQPDVWTKELLQMTMFDLMDEYFESEPFKVMNAIVSWYSGAAAHWEGVAIPAWGCNITLTLYHFSSPRGGMHDYFHAVMRCALAHGAIIRTCCPVDEIIVRDGRAAGVRLRENAAIGGKTIWADRAVVSAVDIRQTFLKLIGPQHLDAGFIQKIKDISLKGGSIYVSHILSREPLRLRAKFREVGADVGGPYPCDSRELYYEHLADVDGRKGNPSLPPERVIWIVAHPWRFDPVRDPQCTVPGHYVVSPFYLNVPPPEYHVEGPDAINKIKDKMNAYMIEAFSQAIENLDSRNVVCHWVNTPYDSEFRNTGLIGGTWCGTRHCKDQLWTNRPLPELARYRVPGIEGLYLCHQTSGHPGGLCLMAIPYNLMHILIEDGICEPGDWWYASPWYIPEKGKISAARRR
jgi:beta-carotene ketolase (CrtO type)